MSILKRLRRILRRYRGILVIGAFLLALLSALTWGYTHWLTDADQSQAVPDLEEVIKTMSSQPVQLILETQYLCGTETEVRRFENKQALESWLAQAGETWELVQMELNSYKVLRQVEDDLSPLCKNEGYFGLSADGKLTLFQGPPTENQVIESFFRLDTDLLNVSLPQNEIELLHQGIRVENVAEYLSILSTYGQYASE